jgi:hypothetical protein
MPWLIQPGFLGKRMVRRKQTFIDAHKADLRRIGTGWYLTKVVIPATPDGDVVVIPVVPTGATAGSPGSFKPAGATPPTNLAALQALGALGQTTAWTTGQSVKLGDGSDAHWNGTAWAAGVAAATPTPAPSPTPPAPPAPPPSPPSEPPCDPPAEAPKKNV